MATNINTLKVVGTSYGVRQKRIAELENGASVTFKLEPGNKYDPLAVAVISENGEHLGYVARDDAQREMIRSALGNCFVVARAFKVGGWRVSYGLRVQWYAVSSMYGFMQYMDKDEEESVSILVRRKNTAQAKKKGGKEYRDQLVKLKRHHKERFDYHEIEALKERKVS